MRQSNEPCLCGDPYCRRCFPGSMEDDVERTPADDGIQAAREENELRIAAKRLKDAKHLVVVSLTGALRVAVDRMHEEALGGHPGYVKGALVQVNKLLPRLENALTEYIADGVSGNYHIQTLGADNLLGDK